MLGTPHEFSTVYARQFAEVTVLDVREDTSALTTYTFSNCNLFNLGSNLTIAEGNNTHPYSRQRGKSFIAVIVHGEDALATFDVSSVTIGGVAGTERTDRGGGTSAINTAIYTWSTDTLEAMPNTDVVVTWSEEVTGCAIGVLLVSNSNLFAGVTNSFAQATGVITTAATSSGTTDRNPVALIGSTCITGGGTERVQFYIGEATSSRTQLVAPMLLYEGSNANFDYAGAWSYAPGYAGGASAEVFAINASWSGTGSGDIIIWVAF